MLKLPEPNLTYKGEDAINFLRGKNNGIELLQEYLQDPVAMSKDLSRIQVSSLKDPYREISWLFTRVTGQDSTTTIPRLALYILYFTVHEDVVFYWEKIISNEIFAQLMNFKSEKKFYMASYLVFSITHCHVFKGLNVGKRVNPKIDPVTMCYQALWRQKVVHCFYEVYNDFVSEFKKLLFGEDTSRISLEASRFLDKKGILEKMDNYNIIRIFCSHENPIYLPYYVPENYLS
jgi:hypothetical protein